MTQLENAPVKQQVDVPTPTSREQVSEKLNTVLTELGWNHSISEQILSISLKETYRYISDDQKIIIDESERLEPPSNGSIQRKTGDFSPVFPSLLRGQDSNLRPSGYEPDELPDCSTPR